MRYLLILLSLILGCEQPTDPKPASQQYVPTTILAGRLGNKAIDEASGIVRSQQHDNVYWLVNDSGKPRLHAIDSTGKNLGQVKLRGAKNVDCDCPDFYRITIYADDTPTTVIYQVYGYIKGGNLQIHPLTGFDS